MTTLEMTMDVVVAATKMEQVEQETPGLTLVLEIADVTAVEEDRRKGSIKKKDTI